MFDLIPGTCRFISASIELIYKISTQVSFYHFWSFSLTSSHDFPRLHLFGCSPKPSPSWISIRMPSMRHLLSHSHHSCMYSVQNLKNMKLKNGSKNKAKTGLKLKSGTAMNDGRETNGKWKADARQLMRLSNGSKSGLVEGSMNTAQRMNKTRRTE